MSGSTKAARSRAEQMFHDFLEAQERGEDLTQTKFVEQQPPDVRDEFRRILADYRKLKLAFESPSAQLTAGQELASYRLIREIGRGGMGVIWEAEDLELERRVALKILNPHYTLAGEGLLRFQREAEACARIQHPSIVVVYAVGSAGDLHYIAQELVARGLSLADRLAEMREALELPSGYYEHTAEFVAEAADALQAAHECGVIHRDVKPSNILFGKGDRPKLVDFGLALVEDKLALSRTGQLVGTPYYMSPEQAASRRMGIDHRTDVFSLGATLYEALTLRRPFEGDTSQQILTKVLVEDPVDPRRIRSQVPIELGVICLKAMEKNPERRYATAAEFAADLRRWLKHEPIRAQPVSAARRAMKWLRRHPTVSVAGGVGAVALVVISALWMKSVASAAESRRLADDVLSLSASQDLDDLIARADELWPADPSRMADFEQWLADARALSDGRAADPVRNTRERPSLAQHEAKLAEIRAQALPQTEAERRADREAHPRYAELLSKQAELTWRSRMLGLEPWPDEAQVAAELANEELPSDALGLCHAVWALVDPEKPAHGFEVRARLLGRRSLTAPEAGTENERVNARVAFAWACFRGGRLDEASAEAYRSIEEIDEAQRDQLKGYVASLEAAIASWRGAELKKRHEERDALNAEIAELERIVAERQTWTFGESGTNWWQEQLACLVADLKALDDPIRGLLRGRVAESYGWSVQERYEFARTIRERSVEGPSAKARWDEATAAIAASPRYGALVISPQLGLLPIGADPDSGLWEFAHLQTGVPAERGEDGKLRVTEQTGLVFVLIPGSTSWRGAQAIDPNGRNYDPHALPQESPVHEVTLSPYFLSKYEMTQGQWSRVTGRNPSTFGPSAHRYSGHSHDLTHPVEQVTWSSCSLWMERLGLALPSEAQWEHGCRAGTDTPWWTGRERESLRGKINIADESAVRGGASFKSAAEDWPNSIDGWTFHARVGSFAPNAFGLHDMHGNVFEWCGGGMEWYSTAKQFDPLPPPNQSCVSRGGSYALTASSARSAHRLSFKPETQDEYTGLRPARSLSAR